MAITINGSGTITGVSAGGLPDGSVDADTLASTLDLSGKTMTYGLTDSDLSSVTTGKVLQVVQGTKTTQTCTTNTSFTDMGLSVNITPSSSSNKVLVIAILNGAGTYNNDRSWWEVHNGSSTVFNIQRAALTYTGGDSISGAYIDSPATTSQITYTVRARMESSGQACLCETNSGVAGMSTLVAMEIAG